MKSVTFSEYQAAKKRIIGNATCEPHIVIIDKVIYKSYCAEKGAFYEVHRAGQIEFWSTKQDSSCVYHT